MTKTIINEAGTWTITANVYSDGVVSLRVGCNGERSQHENWENIELALKQIEVLEKSIASQGQQAIEAEQKRKQIVEPIINKLKQLGFSDEEAVS